MMPKLYRVAEKPENKRVMTKKALMSRPAEMPYDAADDIKRVVRLKIVAYRPGILVYVAMKQRRGSLAACSAALWPSVRRNTLPPSTNQKSMLCSTLTCWPAHRAARLSASLIASQSAQSAHITRGTIYGDTRKWPSVIARIT